jgi:serine/threonine-protein kinase
MDDTLGKYKILENLGKGGFGTVYLAQDLTLDRPAALKVLHPALAADVDFLDRFRQEARVAARFRHPNLVGVYEVGEEQGRFFIAMEYMPGGSLKGRLEQQGRLSYNESHRILQQVCTGLQLAHSQGLVHRDIKPGNILFSADGQAVLSDFGLVKAASLSSGSASSSGMVGTPFYKAPELWLGKPPASPATDVYALACVLYEMLSGELLFPGDTPDQVIARHLVLEPDFSAGWLPEETPAGVEAVLRKALARDPGGRYADAAAFGQALEVLEGPQQPSASEAERNRDEGLKTYPSPNLPPLGGGISPHPAAAPGGEATPTDWRGERGKSNLPLFLSLGLIGIIGIVIVAAILLSNTNKPAQQLAVQITATNTKIATKPIATNTSQPTITATKKPTATRTTKPSPTSTRGPTTFTGSTPPDTAQLGDKWLSSIDNMLLAYIPAGEFEMGSEGGGSDERPVHTVYLDAFWIDTTEVTNAQYAKCVELGDCRAPSDGSWNRNVYFSSTEYADYPVIKVYWQDANNYCEWAGRELPTEAQWEKAARGGLEGMLYPWGNLEPSCQLGAENGANYGRCSYDDTIEVASFAANDYGLYDMVGNVWEWVFDWYDANYYENSTDRNPRGPSSGEYRVLRGGSWVSGSRYLRAAYRVRSAPDYRVDYYGFRCAR